MCIYKSTLKRNLITVILLYNRVMLGIHVLYSHIVYIVANVSVIDFKYTCFDLKPILIKFLFYVTQLEYLSFYDMNNLL